MSATELLGSEGEGDSDSWRTSAGITVERVRGSCSVASVLRSFAASLVDDDEGASGCKGAS